MMEITARCLALEAEDSVLLSSVHRIEQFADLAQSKFNALSKKYDDMVSEIAATDAVCFRSAQSAGETYFL